MKVLVIDAHLGTREAIRDIILADDPNHMVYMASNGGQALNMIVAGGYDAIITSNQLSQYFGSNLLQGIARVPKSTPTLLHSTHPEGYMLVSNDTHDKIDLAAHVVQFDFAQFKVKNRDFSYVAEFILNAKIDQIAEEL